MTIYLFWYPERPTSHRTRLIKLAGKKLMGDELPDTHTVKDVQKLGRLAQRLSIDFHLHHVIQKHEGYCRI